MVVGSYFGVVFEVDDTVVRTFDGLSGTAGSEWAEHAVIGSKSRLQWVAPKNREYRFSVVLKAEHGVDPRAELDVWRSKAEGSEADYLVIGSGPVSDLPFALVELGESWDVVSVGGKLQRCTVEVTVREYL